MSLITMATVFQMIHVQIQVNSSDADLQVFPHTCVATPSDDPDDKTQNDVIVDGSVSRKHFIIVLRQSTSGVICCEDCNTMIIKMQFLEMFIHCLILTRCPKLPTLQFYPSPSPDRGRFGFQAFAYISGVDMVTVKSVT